MILRLEPLYSERKTLTCQFLRSVIDALTFFQIVVAQQVMVCLQKSFENSIFFPVCCRFLFYFDIHAFRVLNCSRQIIDKLGCKMWKAWAHSAGADFSTWSYCGSGKLAHNNSQVLPRGVCKHAANIQIALMYSLIASLNRASCLLCTELHFWV